MANTALYVLVSLILLVGIVIVVLLARKQRNVEPRVDIDSIERCVNEGIRAALRRENEELAKYHGEVFREAKRIDDMLSNDEIDIVSIVETTSTHVLAMLVGRLEDEYVIITSDIRKVLQKISLANAHLASHRSAGLSNLASDEQENVRKLEAQKEHLEERLAAVQRKLDKLQKVSKTSPSDGEGQLHIVD